MILALTHTKISGENLNLETLIQQCNCQYGNVIPYEYSPCSIPQTLQGEWFSREHGENILTVIDSTSFSTHGRCIDQASLQFDNFTFVLQQGSCYHCVRLLVRTLNVLEKIETGCVNLNFNDRPSMASICRNLDPNQELVTMFCRFSFSCTFWVS